MRPGDIAAAAGVDKEEAAKIIKKLAKEGKIDSAQALLLRYPENSGRMVRLMICLSALLLRGGADLLSARGRELVAGSYNIRCDTPVDGDNAWPYRKERARGVDPFLRLRRAGECRKRSRPIRAICVRCPVSHRWVWAATGETGAKHPGRSFIARTVSGYSTAARSGSPRRPIPFPKGGMRP